MGSSETSGNREALKNSKTAWNTYNSDYGNWKDQYEQYRQKADESFNQDYGNSAREYLEKANKAGIASANQQLDAGARAATNQAQRASRSAGLTKGQAAMNAVGAAGNLYNQQWGNAVTQGTQNYGNAVNMNQQKQQQGMGNSMNLMGQAQNGMQGAMNIQSTVGANQKSDFDKTMGIMAGVGGIAQGVGSMMPWSDVRVKKDIEPTSWEASFAKRLSALASGYASGGHVGKYDNDDREPLDETPWARKSRLLQEHTKKLSKEHYTDDPGRLKRNLEYFDNRLKEDPDNEALKRLYAQINSAASSDERLKEAQETGGNRDMLTEVAEKINNYLYHYKPGTGEDPSIEYSGPMAQDLLEVDGYRSAVFEDKNGLLKVDTGRLAMVNSGMISDLAKRLLLLEGFIKSVMENISQIQEPMPDVE